MSLSQLQVWRKQSGLRKVSTSSTNHHTIKISKKVHWCPTAPNLWQWHFVSRTLHLKAFHIESTTPLYGENINLTDRGGSPGRIPGHNHTWSWRSTALHLLNDTPHLTTPHLHRVTINCIINILEAADDSDRPGA